MDSGRKVTVKCGSIGLLSIAVAAHAAGAGSVGSGSPCLDRTKMIFDGTLYLNKTAGTSAVMSPIRIVYSSEMWRSKAEMENPPSKAAIDQIASSVSPATEYVVLDIENWDLSGRQTAVSTNAEKLKRTLENFRAALPGKKLGIYGMPPLQDYWRAIAKPESVENHDWRRDNDVFLELATLLDAAFPSLYTYYVDEAGWERFANAQIAEARRLLPGKPVYPFLWWKYHDGNRHLKDKDLPAIVWSQELRSACAWGDGAVVWGGWKEQWQPEAPWFQEVMAQRLGPIRK